MSNPLIGAIGGQAQSHPQSPVMGGGGVDPAVIQQIKQTMNALKSVANPMQAIMQAAQQNPQLGAVMQMCQGRNPQEVFMEKCQQNGVDPNAAIQQIRQMLS